MLAPVGTQVRWAGGVGKLVIFKLHSKLLDRLALAIWFCRPACTRLLEMDKIQAIPMGKTKLFSR